MRESLLTIAHNAYTESLRQPIYVVMLLLVAGLIAVSPTFTAYTLEDDNKLLIDLGLSSIFLGGLFLASFTTAGVLDREIRNRTVVMALTKPVGRPTFLLGKYAGVLGAMGTAFWIWSLTFLLTIRHGVLMRASDVYDKPVLVFGLSALSISVLLSLHANYFRSRAFGSSLTFWLAPLLGFAYGLALCFDRNWGTQSMGTDLDPQLVLALVVLFEGLAVVAAVAVAASTRLGRLLTLTTCAVVVGLGLVSDYLFGGFESASTGARLGYLLVPNLQLYWLADALTQGHAISSAYVTMVTLYSLLYVTAGLAVAVLLFQTRDVS